MGILQGIYCNPWPYVKYIVKTLSLLSRGGGGQWGWRVVNVQPAFDMSATQCANSGRMCSMLG